MSLPSALFGLLLVVGVPLLSSRSAALAEAARLPRSALYANASASLWALFAIGYLVIRLDGQGLAEVVVAGAPVPVAVAAGWAAALTLAGLAIFVAGHGARRLLGLPREGTMLERLRPTTPAEAAWVGLALSPSAGICEEFLYRGFLLSRLVDLTGSPPAAVLISSSAFGLAHGYQGWAGAARAGLIGLVLCLPPVFLGSLLPSMAAHILIDVVGILVVWPLMERQPPGDPAPPAS